MLYNINGKDMVERLIFLGETVNKDLTPFIQSANFTFAGILPREPRKNQVLFLADRCLNIKKNGEESQLPLLVIDDKPEELLNAARNMVVDQDEMSRKAVGDLRGSLTLIKLEPNILSDVAVDASTGIRVVHLDSRQTPYPIHPTPNS